MILPSGYHEPIVEGVESLLGEEARRAVVEVGVELVDHGLVAQHREEPDGEGQDGAVKGFKTCQNVCILKQFFLHTEFHYNGTIRTLSVASGSSWTSTGS